VHTTIFRQEKPDDNTDSIYEVFERINSGGIKLSDQKIRVCVNFGDSTELLKQLNDTPSWRELYGTKSARLKDQELILRFLALTHNLSKYSRPMRTFLNRFMETNKKLGKNDAAKYSSEFKTAIDFVHATLGRRAFRPERSLNTAVFDAVMVGISSRLRNGPVKSAADFVTAYDQLLADSNFREAYTRSTADEDKVKLRLKLASDAFEKLP
jgi:hypothetical protein